MTDSPLASLQTDIVRLIDAVNGNTAKLDVLAGRVRVNRRGVWIALVGLLFDLILSAGLVYSLHGTNEAQRRTDANEIADCINANEAAVKQHQLWEGVLTLTERTPNPTTIEGLRRLLDETFPQKDCAAL